MQEVSNSTAGQIQLGPGTLYGAVKRLLAAGMIEESDERPDPNLDDQRRRYYRLTPFGRKILAAEIDRMEATVQLARKRRLAFETLD
jgi:DNA-binding PadR family transcriptional regulator